MRWQGKVTWSIATALYSYVGVWQSAVARRYSDATNRYVKVKQGRIVQCNVG